MGVVLALPAAVASGEVSGPDPIETAYVRMILAPENGARASEFTLKTTRHNLAGVGGLLNEGFGVPSLYVPGRRLNERVDIVEEPGGRRVARYSYDADGPNIKGLRVVRTVEALPDTSSLRIRWAIVNKGDEEHWVAPWVGNSIAPGGTLDPEDRIDFPTLDGIVRATRSAFYPASRNWAAATDPVAKETVYAVFHANLLHSLLARTEVAQNVFGFQAAFVPRTFKPGETVETTYFLNVVRGLSHVDFASEEFAGQVDYKGDRVELVLAGARKLPLLRIRAAIRSAADGQVWQLAPKQFTLTPDVPIRCTFPWTAPGDGAYALLAKLDAGGKPFSLGGETGSPHGGIDTQFVVGKPGRAPLEAWTNAPDILNRGARILRRATLQANGTDLWFESSVEKIFREDRPEPTGDAMSGITLDMARNESESFQLVVHPPKGKTLRDVNVAVRELAGQTGGSAIPASAIRVANVAYYSVRVPTHFEGPTGQWPDALPRFKPFLARGGESSPIWFTLYIPADQVPGPYEGVFELSSPDLDAPVSFKVRVRVRTFALPRTPALKTDFGIWAQAASEGCRRLRYTGSEADLAQAYLDNAFRHRVTLTPLVHLPEKSEDYAAALQAYAPKLRGLRRQGASSVAVPPALLDAPAALAAANRFVVDNDLRGQAFCPIADEPSHGEWAGVFERLKKWKQTAPDIAAMLTASGLQPFLPDSADVWAVHLPMFDTVNNRPILERIAQGGEVWCYVNDAPSRPYGNFFIDFSSIEHRILFWQAWALGVKGFRYACINVCDPERDAYADLVDAVPTQGNGFLVYPGPEGPVDSIRWENIRDGIEDYDYLVLLRERTEALRQKGGDAGLLARAQAAANLKTLVPDLLSYPRTPSALLIKRAEIGDVLDELGAALGAE